MGLFSIFSRKVESADSDEGEEAVVEEQEDIEVREEKEEATERQLINRISLLYDKKSKLVSARNAYLKASRSLANSLKTVSAKYTALKQRIKMLPKKAMVSAVKGIAGYVGLKGNIEMSAEAEVAQIKHSIDIINQSLALEKAQESAVFQSVSNTRKVIKEQQDALKQYIRLLAEQDALEVNQSRKASGLIGNLSRKKKRLDDEAALLK